MLSNVLAAHALSPAVRPRLMQRSRNYVRNGFEVLKNWMDNQNGLFTYTPPDASAVSFIRYHLDVNSTELVERLRDDLSVLIVPGDHFGIDHCLRISFGLPHD